jgi:hypothetical protein
MPLESSFIGGERNSYVVIISNYPVMAKINETLSKKAHQVLRKYQFGRSKANQVAALNSLLPEYWELLEIASDLAECRDPIENEEDLCVLCAGTYSDHDAKCPWIRARKITGDLK